MIDKNMLISLYPDLSNNIRSIRKKLNLTQKELAKKANISFRTIQNYEKGLTPPSIKTIEKIALALGVSVERLISKYVFDDNITATDILERMSKVTEFKENINNLILTDILFDIVDLEIQYKNGTLQEVVLDKSLGGRNNIDYNTKYFLIKIMLERKLQCKIDELKKDMINNCIDFKKIYRSKDDKGCIIEKEKYE